MKNKEETSPLETEANGTASKIKESSVPPFFLKKETLKEVLECIVGELKAA
jgi:hypothetical protein